ncbi:tetratricopeptide repeat protein [Rivibacter subsaxonicus]|uniref:TPR repeat protein n=1 Tax=Rivibacter subsaxonicus TaxID=457575 RepID=A0A4V2FSQ8_9BURK|nr:tetratricopeptide repeat protein [Rivibacter subsaxonicus]RZT95135.1 TPR repeat protein [Rivibacter subsaxonicus]
MSMLRIPAGLLAVALLAGTPAFADMNDSTEAAPSAPDLSRELKTARGQIEQQRYAEAITTLKAAEQKDPTNANVHNWLGYSYRKSGNLDAAFRSYGTALKLDPKHKGAHEYIGEAYLMARQPDKAREHLVALKSICGTGCEEYRDLEQAIAAYKP